MSTWQKSNKHNSHKSKSGRSSTAAHSLPLCATSVVIHVILFCETGWLNDLKTHHLIWLARQQIFCLHLSLPIRADVASLQLCLLFSWGLAIWLSWLCLHCKHLSHWSHLFPQPQKIFQILIFLQICVDDQMIKRHHGNYDYEKQS